MSTRLWLFVVSTLVIAFASPVSARAQAPPTLSGELLTATELTTTPDCPSATEPGSFTFAASGVATGPYPGTFTETGRVTVTAREPGSRTIVEEEASFTIISGTIVITGTKQVSPIDPTPGAADCEPGNVVAALPKTLDYEAFIETPTGTFVDRGLSTFQLFDFTDQPDRPDVFEESFFSLLTEPVPATTSGTSTGGGKVAPNVTFGFNAKSDRKGIKGTCNVIDHVADVHIMCDDPTTYVQSGNHAHFSGIATVNGVQTTYRIDVDDNGEPGVGRDTFRIVTGTGYTAAGVLTQGNVQVHR